MLQVEQLAVLAYLVDQPGRHAFRIRADDGFFCQICILLHSQISTSTAFREKAVFF
jgi:hypothetical protein